MQQVASSSPTRLRREASPLGRCEASPLGLCEAGAYGKLLIERFFFIKEEKFKQWRYNETIHQGDFV